MKQWQWEDEAVAVGGWSSRKITKKKRVDCRGFIFRLFYVAPNLPDIIIWGPIGFQKFRVQRVKMVKMVKMVKTVNVLY